MNHTEIVLLLLITDCPASENIHWYPTPVMFFLIASTIIFSTSAEIPIATITTAFCEQKKIYIN